MHIADAISAGGKQIVPAGRVAYRSGIWPLRDAVVVISNNVGDNIATRIECHPTEIKILRAGDGRRYRQRRNTLKRTWQVCHAHIEIKIFGWAEFSQMQRVPGYVLEIKIDV